MKRRAFITLLGGAAVWPLAARAQQERMRRIAVLSNLASDDQEGQTRNAAFLQALQELGWTVGRNVRIDYRWGLGNAEFYRKQAADLVSLAKRLELLREAVPALRRLAILGNVGNPFTVLEIEEVKVAARTLGLEVHTREIRRAQDIAPAFETLRGRTDAIYVSTDPLVFTNLTRINTLALGSRLPTIYPSRNYVEAGGLMSYGPNYPDLFRRAADHVDKILRGAKPNDLPIEQPTKFDLIINLTTAKTLGLTIPESILLRADEVIE